MIKILESQWLNLASTKKANYFKRIHKFWCYTISHLSPCVPQAHREENIHHLHGGDQFCVHFPHSLRDLLPVREEVLGVLQKRTSLCERKLLHDDQNSSEWEGKLNVQRACHGEGKDGRHGQHRRGQREFSPSIQHSSLLRDIMSLN